MRSLRPRQAAGVAALLTALLGTGWAAPATTGGTPERQPAKPPAPACLRCGGTCDLEPICVCSAGTKKIPTVEYDVDCDSFCVAGCGSAPWPFGRRKPVACGSCDESPGDSPGRVRTKKVLRKESTTKDVDVVERRVEYLCGPCSGRTPATCCGGGEPSRSAPWWTRLIAWWP